MDVLSRGIYMLLSLNSGRSRISHMDGDNTGSANIENCEFLSYEIVTPANQVDVLNVVVTLYGLFLIILFKFLFFQDLVRFVKQQAAIVEEQSKTIQEQSITMKEQSISLLEQSMKNDKLSMTVEKQSVSIKVSTLCHSVYCD